MGPILGGVPRLKITNATARIACQGNSLTIGDGVPFQSGQDYVTVLQGLSAVNSQFTIRNDGSSGQITSQMITTAQGTFYDNIYTAGKTNIVILWEGTNSIGRAAPYGGLTGVQAAAEMQTLVSTILSKHSDYIIIILTALPQMNFNYSTAQVMQYIDDYNAIIKSDYRSWGAKAVCDVRQAGYPWAALSASNYSTPAFEDMGAGGAGPYWKAAETTHLHLNNLGYAKIAEMVNTTLLKLPRS